jgi:hypothetical protein
MDEAYFAQEGAFKSQQPCLGRSKPTCCTCSLPSITLCSQCLGSIVHDILIGPYLLPWRLSVQIDWVFLEEKLPEMLEEIPLAFRRNVVPA